MSHSGSEQMLARELEEVDRAQREVEEMVAEGRLNLEEVRGFAALLYMQGGGLLLTLMPTQINADGLVAVVEKKAQGEAVAPEEVIDIQVRPYVPRVSSTV
jgi:uncharacterized protein YlxW (UPF0749 family)